MQLGVESHIDYQFHIRNSLSLTHSELRMTINHYDCVYMDRRGNRRTWVTPAKDPAHVISMFNELVGEGRIIKIMPAEEWD